MAENCDRIWDFIEKHPESLKSDNEKLTQLISNLTVFEKKEIVIYCQIELKKIKRKLFLRNLQSFGLGLLLAIILYIPFSSLNAGFFASKLVTYIFIFNCISLVSFFRLKNHPLVKNQSKYISLKSKFSSK